MQKHAELPQPFADLGIEVRFLKALRKMNFREPSDIQRALIPPALDGKDLLGQAKTGTGKTAAFGLPILQQLDGAQGLQALCLAPTRELAVQVSAELDRMAEFTKLRIVPIYGGQRMTAQRHKLGRKPHFVVGTPGRVMDFMRRGEIDISDLRFAVLDEVDRMLDIGFRDDIRAILSKIKSEHQTIFVSATLSDDVKKLARTYMHEPDEVNVSEDVLTVDTVEQSYVSVAREHKFRVLRDLLENEDIPLSIVFCNTRAMTRKLASKLHEAGIEAKEIHGDLMQRKRDKVMEWFRKHRLRVLVATDLAARGIDVSAVSHIINYDVPVDPEIYVHRIGRTARMGAKGVAITFITPEEGKELTQIEMLINREVPERKVGKYELRKQEEKKPKEEAPEKKKAPSRLMEPATAPSEHLAGKRPARRTLGGRFKPTRRRRL
jgi:ATP-dependent RNA helicase DeaD